MLDYAAGGSFGVGMTASATHVYTTGSFASSLKLENPITGAGVQGADEGSDRDVFVAKVTVDGVPEAVFTYPSAEDSTGLSTSYPRDIHVSEDGETLVLEGHVALANPLWRWADGGIPALAMFQGPHAYVHPGWYPAKREHGKVVPTWNYVVIQAHGTLSTTRDPA